LLFRYAAGVSASEKNDPYPGSKRMIVPAGSSGGMRTMRQLLRHAGQEDRDRETFRELHPKILDAGLIASWLVQRAKITGVVISGDAGNSESLQVIFQTHRGFFAATN